MSVKYHYTVLHAPGEPCRVDCFTDACVGLTLECIPPARIYPINYLGDAPWMIPVRGWWRDPE